MTYVRLTAGNSSPEFSLISAAGSTVSLSDFLGKKVIVYFYPEAMTPGCTTQACDFRDNLGSLSTHGYSIVGISRDEPEKLSTFAQQDGLSFPLLSDPDRHVHDLYGTYGEKNSYGKIIQGVIRSTFIIDESGLIAHAFYNVKATGHVAMLRKKLKIDN